AESLIGRKRGSGELDDDVRTAVHGDARADRGNGAALLAQGVSARCPREGEKGSIRVAVGGLDCTLQPLDLGDLGLRDLAELANRRLCLGEHRLALRITEEATFETIAMGAAAGAIGPVRPVRFPLAFGF